MTMMTWSYRVASKIIDDTRVYGIIEVYYDEHDKPALWTDFIGCSGFDDANDLKITLERMLEAFDEPPLEIDDDNLK